MNEDEFSLKNYFVPLTTKKAVHFIIIVGLVVFFNSLFNGFVGDDFGQLLDNPLVHTIFNIPQFFMGSSFNESGRATGIYYKPLMQTFFALIYSLHGPTSFFFHLYQLLLHIGNALLVFWLFKYFFKKEIGLILALIFLVHPINSEAVLYISNLQDVLFLFFGLWAVVFSLKPPTTKNFYFILIFLICSLLSKTTGILFIVIVILISLLFNQKNVKKSLIYLPLMLIFYVLIHYSVVGSGYSKDQPFPIMRVSLQERLTNIPNILFFYFKTFFYPKDLALGYQGVIKTISFENYYFPLIVLGVLSTLWALLLYKLKQNRRDLKVFILFSAWFLFGIGLHIQLIPLDFIVADRWFYFPIIGLLGIFGLLLTKILPKVQKIPIVLLVLYLILLSILSYRSFLRTLDWRDGLTLGQHDTTIVKDSYSLYSYYGVELYNAGRYDESLINFNKSITLASYWDLNWNYLGQTQERKGALLKDRKLIIQAEKSYKRAIKNSKYDIPTVNYAHLLVYYFDSNMAKNFINKSLERYPNSSGLFYNLAIVEIMNGNYTEARLAAKKAYMLNPTSMEIQNLYIHLQNDSPVTIEKADF